MPLPRRQSSFLGQSASTSPSERTGSVGGVGRLSGGSTSAPRGVYVGVSPAGCTGITGSGLGARVSRRALGISSVFLQGLRSSTVPLLPQARERGGQPAFEGLNACLLEYRDKVRALEQLNQQLEEQIRHSLDRKASCTGNWGTLRHDWEDIHRQVSEAILDNARLMLQTENVQASAEDFKDRYENEQPFRKAVEEEISSLYKVIDDAEQTQKDLEAQTDDMNEELRELARNHEQDVKQLYNQLVGSEVEDFEAPIETSLDQILAYIRSHWERAIEKTRSETDAYLEHKQAESKLSHEEEELESLKAECNDASCKVQSLQAETESMRALKRGLENSLNDAKHWHNIELQNLGSVIGKLEAELGEVRSDIDQQRRDFETLHGNKRRLELEIGTYHGIMDGEESRYHPAMSSGRPAAGEGNPAPPPSDLHSTAQTEGEPISTSPPQKEK